MLNPQLTLTLKLKDSATFASYWASPNAEILAHLRQLIGSARQPAVYLWGAPGCGKSHLLQALCHAAGEQHSAAVYLPMDMADQFPREALQGLENVEIVCIDDIQVIAGDPDWELAFIHLFERIGETGAGLVVAGNAIPAELGFKLPQLASRLSWGLAFQLQPLSDADKLSALRLRASRRGIELPLESGRYIVRHYGQTMSDLYNALESLDQASLAAKRKLTIPFIRAALNNGSHPK